MKRADPKRWDRHILDYFRDHRRRWLAGEITLAKYVEAWKDTPSGQAPLWYAPPLGFRAIPDKKAIFDKLGYRPTEPQARFHASLAKVKTFSGGAGAGKSFAAAMDALPILMTPGTKTWLVAPQYDVGQFEFDYIADALRHECWGGFFESMMKKENGGKYQNQAKNGKLIIKLYWPDFDTHSICEVKTGKTDSGLLGISLDYCILCEGSQLPRRIIENKLLMRMFRGGGVMAIPSSPNGMGWVADLYLKGLSGVPGYFSTNADTRMNPLYATEEKFAELMLWSQDMSDTDFNEQVGGRPQSRHGNVYPDFDVAVHVQTWEDDWPKPGWKVARAIDFGYTDPWCCLYVAFDEDHRAYVFHELYERKQLPDDQIRLMADFEGATLEEPTGERPWLRYKEKGKSVNPTLPTVLDWDASDREHYARAGIRPQRMAVKDIGDGIKAVNRALKIAGDGRPRLYIHRSCRNLLRELATYEWGDKSEKPKDGNDHACDALRYAVRTLTKVSLNPRVEVVSL